MFDEGINEARMDKLEEDLNRLQLWFFKTWKPEMDFLHSWSEVLSKCSGRS